MATKQFVVYEVENSKVGCGTIAMWLCLWPILIFVGLYKLLTPKYGKSKSAAITIGIMFFLFIVVSVKEEMDKREIESAQPELTIKVEKLFKEYIENEVTIEAKFKDKIIQVSGVVQEMRKDGFEDFSVVLYQDGLKKVQCIFSEENRKEVAKISTGNKVTIKGKCDSFSWGITLKYCRLVSLTDTDTTSIFNQEIKKSFPHGVKTQKSENSTFKKEVHKDTKETEYSSPKTEKPNLTEEIKPISKKFDLEAMKIWDSKLKEMEENYTKIQTEDFSLDLMIATWEQFQKSYQEDNPYSQKDDRIREQIKQDITRLKEKQKIHFQWNEYHQEMQVTYSKIKARKLNDSQISSAWKEFLEAYLKNNPLSEEDEKMRSYAEEIIGKLDRKWSNYTDKMRKTYQKIKTAKMKESKKIQIWKKFLQVYSEDNPFSEEDDQMRSYARNPISDRSGSSIVKAEKHFQKALGYYAKGKNEEMWKENEQAIALNSDARYLSLKASMLFSGKFVSKDTKQSQNMARGLIDKLENNSDSFSQFMLGYMYYYGLGTNPDGNRAFQWATKSAKSGNSLAMNLLAIMHIEGKGISVDYSKAFQWSQKSTDLGNSYGMNILGIIYLEGKGISQDNSKAFELYKTSAKLGNAYGMGSLGALYLEGIGVSKNYTKALHWVKQATELDDANAMRVLGIMYLEGKGVPKNYVKALDWLQKSADRENTQAMMSLAFFYYNREDVPRDFSKAHYWFKKAADLNDPFAMSILGALYIQGQGIAINYEEAFYWAKKSSELGNAFGMSLLGSLYLEGKGVPLNYSLGYEWLQKGADLGNSGAMNALGTMYYNGVGVRSNYTEAFKWFKKAADLGEVNAMYTLGEMFNHGRGTIRDKVEAIEWFKKAARKGHSEAQRILNLWMESW